MSVLVYNGEKFQRTKVRYLVFSVVFASVFVLSILSNNTVGAVLLFFLLGGYFYYSTVNNQVIKIIIEDAQLIIGNKSYPWNMFTGYILEIYPNTQNIKNIIFLTAKTHLIYTFDDSLDHVHLFLDEIDRYLPRLQEFHQSSLEKISRKIKL